MGRFCTYLLLILCTWSIAVSAFAGPRVHSENRLNPSTIVLNASQQEDCSTSCENEACHLHRCHLGHCSFIPVSSVKNLALAGERWIRTSGDQDPTLIYLSHPFKPPRALPLSFG